MLKFTTARRHLQRIASCLCFSRTPPVTSLPLHSCRFSNTPNLLVQPIAPLQSSNSSDPDSSPFERLKPTLLHHRSLSTAEIHTHDSNQHAIISTDKDVMGEVQIVSFPLAQTGEGIAECEFVEWECKEGDIVGEFDKLCQVQSDKASIDISSPYAGIIRKLHHKKGDIVKVGEPLMDIEISANAGRQETLAGAEPCEAKSHHPSKPSPPPTPSSPAPAPSPPAHSSPAASPSTDTIPKTKPNQATPAVRNLARDLGIDLTRTPFVGSGPDGRILAEDVISDKVCPNTSSFPPQPDPIPSIIPVRGYRRTMIKSMMTASEVPLFHLHDEVCLDELLRVRRVLQEDPAMGSTKLTLLPIILKALSTVLVSPRHAILNASLALPASTQHHHQQQHHHHHHHQQQHHHHQQHQQQEAAIHVHADHNIGVAMATAHGLAVPNIKAVQDKTVPQLALELFHLQQAATQTKLKPHELEGGTITISNIGSIGGLFANPLVTPPQVAIIALGRMRRVPRWVEPSIYDVPKANNPNGPAPGLHRASRMLSWERDSTEDHSWRSSMGVSWGADHRVVDGAGLALANNAWKALLEEPAKLLLSLK